MSKQPIISSKHTTGNRGTLHKYIIGFVLSVVLTLVAYGLVKQHVSATHGVLSEGLLIAVVLALAVIQLAVQLQFFIHLGHESKPHWNKLAFLFMLLIVFIIVGGSLWIMDNLHYNMMSPQETETHLKDNEGIL